MKVASIACAVALLGLGAAAEAKPSPRVHVLSFSYPSSSGVARTAYLVVPSWYGARRHPALPLVISPHGRGVDGRYNLRFWGTLPADGPFVLVSPDGGGRRLPLYSWGYRGQIADLARMPLLARAAFPWLTIARRRIYAVGASMGAQEALLLASRSGISLAGVAAFDPVTDLAARYRAWPRTAGEHALPARARIELGGTPEQVPRAYAARSPAAELRAIVSSRVPIELWWSRRDRVVTDQPHQTGLFYRRLVALAPAAPVQEIVGYWQHGHAMHPRTQLRAALACFRLVPSRGVRVPRYLQRGGPGGSVEELPPARGRSEVRFRRSFCGRSGT